MMTERVLFLPSVGICLLLDVVVTEVQLTWLWSLRVLTQSLPSAIMGYLLCFSHVKPNIY